MSLGYPLSKRISNQTSNRGRDNIRKNRSAVGQLQIKVILPLERQCLPRAHFRPNREDKGIDRSRFASLGFRFGDVRDLNVVRSDIREANIFGLELTTQSGAV